MHAAMFPSSLRQGTTTVQVSDPSASGRGDSGCTTQCPTRARWRTPGRRRATRLRNGATSGTGLGADQAGPPLQGGEVGQGEQVVHVAHAQPVLLRLRHLQAQALGQHHRPVPEEVPVGDQDPGAGRADGVQAVQQGLDVVDVAQEVGEDHVVEGGAQGQGVGVALQEEEPAPGVCPGCAVAGAGLADHAPGDVDAHAEGGAQRRQEVARPAAELQDGGPGGDHRPRQALDLLVVVAVTGLPLRPLGGQAVEPGPSSWRVLSRRPRKSGCAALTGGPVAARGARTRRPQGRLVLRVQ